MNRRSPSAGRSKLGYFALEGINSFATTIFFAYLPFVMKQQYGFSDRSNLLLIALHGFTYVFSSWQGGRFSERAGYFRALRYGYFGMTLALLVGLTCDSLAGQVIALVLWTIPLCLIWPTLEVLVSRGEDMQGKARMVGLYNLVWAVTNAVGFNCGGWVLEQVAVLGLTARQALYVLPMAFMIGQFFLVLWLEKRGKLEPAIATPPAEPLGHVPEEAALHQPIPPQRFLQMAWLVNPFAYVAVNTLAALLPQLAGRFALTTAQAGLYFSLWPYARAVSFFVLWRWTGWHYRFRWLLVAFLGLIASFTTMMLAPNLAAVIVAQLGFGAAVGFMYYSSLFYSMDVGDAKGDHGGLHEAAIGLGTFAGPALGAATLTLFPQQVGSGALAVSVLLFGGLGGLAWLRARRPS